MGLRSVPQTITKDGKAWSNTHNAKDNSKAFIKTKASSALPPKLKPNPKIISNLELSLGVKSAMKN